MLFRQFSTLLSEAFLLFSFSSIQAFLRKALKIYAYTYNIPALNPIPNPMQPLQLPCYCGSLRQVTRAVTQLYDAHLKPMGITITQFGLLKLLSAFPEMTSGAMAEAMVMDSTTLTRTLAGLKKQSWIVAVPGEDKRERHWQLTREGRQLLEQATPCWKAAQQELKKRAKNTDLAGLSQTAYELVQKLGT